MADSCVFCEIVAERAPATVLQRTRVVTVLVPLTPVVDGHVLIIPNRHVVDAGERPALTAGVFMHAAAWAADRGLPFNLVTSAGRAATQSIFHLHVHYVPRTTDDLLMLPWGTLHGENPAEPHFCRQLRAVGRRWNDGPRERWIADVGDDLPDLLDDLGDRAQKWDADHAGDPRG